MWNILDYILPHFERQNIIYEKESEFFNITVQDTETHYRKLIFLPNNGSQSKIDLNNPKHVILNFMRYSFIALAAQKHEPQNVLFIGLGAGTMPMFLRDQYPELNIDIVEIDPGVKPVAKKYFGFSEDHKMKVISMDGRAYVNNFHNKYDIIFIDAYNSKSIPFPLTTKEFFHGIKKNLTQEGIIVSNIANFGDSDYTYSQFKTINESFKYLAVFICPWQTNYVLFASNENLFQEKGLKKASKTIDKNNNWSFKITNFLKTRMNNDTLYKKLNKQTIISDDFAPFGD
jgi:spermidine synthase